MHYCKILLKDRIIFKLTKSYSFGNFDRIYIECMRIPVRVNTCKCFNQGLGSHTILSLRKTLNLYLSLELQFLCCLTDNTDEIVIRKESNQIFVSFILHTKFPALNLRSSLNLRNNCEPGPRSLKENRLNLVPKWSCLLRVNGNHG